jgi:hypothetical protein
MANDLELSLRIRTDLQRATREIRGLREDLKKSGGGAKSAQKDLGGMNRELDKSRSKMLGMGSTATRLRGLLTGLFAAVSFRAITQATIRQEEALAQVEARIRSTGGVAGYTTAQLAKMASELQGVTTFGDEAVLEMQSLLLTFTRVQGEVFRDSQELILDVATAMRTDLKSAALQVGKALNDPLRGLDALNRSGIQFSDQQKEVIKQLVETGRTAEAQRIILKELEVQFGGAARAARQTFGGALTGLSNAFGDLLEANGGMPEAREEIEQLTTLLSDPNTVKGIDAIVSGVIRLTGALAGAAAVSVDVTRFLAESAAKAIYGPADIVERVDDQIRDLSQQLNTIERQIETQRGGGLLNRWLYGDQGELEARAAEIRKEIEGLRQWRAELAAENNNAPPATPPSAPTGAPAPTTDNAGPTEKQIKAQAKYDAELERAARAVRDTLDPMEPLRREMQQLDELLENGKISWDEWSEATLNVQQRMDEMNGKMSETEANLDQFAVQAARNLQSAFADFLFDPFEEGLKGMLRGFVDIIRRMAAEALAAKLAQSLFGDIGSGSLGGVIGGALASVFHDGGVVGAGGGNRTVSPLVFAGAARYHSGGIAGLAPDEVPAILRRNEEVLTENDPRNRLNGGGASGAQQSMRFVLVDDRANIGDYLSSSEGEKVQIETIRRNAMTIRTILS